VLELLSHEFDLLMGRRTYEIWAAFWPSASHPVANAINKAAKYVATKSLSSLGWTNSHRLGGDVVDEVRRLKESDGPELSGAAASCFRRWSRRSWSTSFTSSSTRWLSARASGCLKRVCRRLV
jgi:hypothetical protein